MTESPAVVAKVFACGIVAAGLLNMYIVRTLRTSSEHLGDGTFVDNNVVWARRLRLSALLGQKTLEHMRTRTALFPILELACGTALAASVAMHGLGAPFVRDVLYILLAFSAGVISWQGDAGEYSIPDSLTYPGILLGVLLSTLGESPAWEGLQHGVLGTAVGYLVIRLPFYDLHKRLRGFEGMGLGIAKLLAVVGAFYGPVVALAALLLAASMGTFVALLWYATAGNTDPVPLAKRQLPFGPQIAAAGFVCGLIGGERFVTWFTEPIQTSQTSLNLEGLESLSHGLLSLLSS